LKSELLFVPIAVATDPKHAEIAVLPPSMLPIPPVSAEDLLPEILSGAA
jgi:hypothetical protein